MRDYFVSKLSEINYRMSIHPGTANQRLASEAIKILLLPSNQVPEELKEEFDKLILLLRNTIKSLPAPGLTPQKIINTNNAEAVKYIKLLITIEDKNRN